MSGRLFIRSKSGRWVQPGPMKEKKTTPKEVQLRPEALLWSIGEHFPSRLITMLGSRHNNSIATIFATGQAECVAKPSITPEYIHTVEHKHPVRSDCFLVERFHGNP